MAEQTISPPKSWGGSTVHTSCPLDCPDCCSLDVTVERGKVVKIDGSKRAHSTEGYICGKVRGFSRRIYGEDRLLYPAVRVGPKGKGEFQRIEWNEALDLVALKMREARAEFGAESVLPY